MLAEAGYPDGFDLTITVPSNYQPHMDTAQVVAEQLRAIGVNVTIDPVEWASWLENVYSGRRYQATVVGVDASTLTARAMEALPQLRDCEMHSTQMLHSGDEGTLRRLGLRLTCEAIYPGKDLFF
mgnify:CR=1 FL=1